MTNRLYYFSGLCFLLFITLSQCAKEPTLPVSMNNEGLLFPNAAPLSVRQVMGMDEIGFLIGDDVGAYLSLSIYEAPPELINGRVEESGVPLWSFFGPVTAGSELTLAEGTLREDLEALDVAYFLCNTENLYWAAWSWEETAHFVTFSSKKVNLLEEPGARPALELLDFEIVGNGPADTLVRAGREIRLQLRIGNTGDLLATGIRYSLRQERITDLPQDQPLDNIIPGSSLTEEVSINIPASAAFDEVFTFQLLFTSNDCVDIASEFTIKVNSIQVSLVDIRLTRILYAPDGGLWDLCALPVSFNPDVYYELYSPSRRLDTSLVIDDVLLDNEPHVADFPNLTPPIELSFDTTYRVEFWDDDICFVPTEPDFIGVTEFTPFDYGRALSGQLLTI